MKKKHYTKAQMLSIYAGWQQSGISKKAYCQQNGLTTSTFFYWIKKLALHEQDGVKESASAGFAELDFSPHHAQVFMEIAYPSGVRVKLYRQAEANWIKSLL